MGEKVVGIIGSPRKGGNTELLVNEVLRGAQSEGAKIETLNLYDLSIKPCIACDGCQRDGVCVVKDDIHMLSDTLETADTIVFGTPVYWWGPSGQFKAFMDRWYSSKVRSSIKNKKIIIAVTMGDGEEATARHTIGMLHDSLGYIGTEIIDTLVGMNSYNKGEIAGDRNIMEKGYLAGKKAVRK